MGRIWAVLCLVLFFITFVDDARSAFTPSRRQKSSPKQDFADLFKNGPWKVMFCDDAGAFLPSSSLRGGALYNYYHHYADKAAMFDWAANAASDSPPLADAPVPGGIFGMARLHRAWRPGRLGEFHRRRRVQQHRQHARHRGDDRGHFPFAGAVAKIREEGRCRRRASDWRPLARWRSMRSARRMFGAWS